MHKSFCKGYEVKEADMKLKNAIIVRKITRYEYEKYILKPDLSENDLKEYINRKGSNYEFLLHRHLEYAKCLTSLKAAFQKRDIKYKIFQRYTFKPEYVNWADAVFSLGGDGTFLLAATMMKDPNKPLIGFNSDLDRSVGFLCLPRRFSVSFDRTLDSLINHRFSWFKRQRIRLKMKEDLQESHFNLYDNTKEHFFLQDIHDFEDSTHISRDLKANHKQQVSDDTGNKDTTTAHTHSPILALNEIFIGEKLAARVSFYELSIDKREKEKQKSSGLMVSTGTGSTSWYFNSNNINKKTVKEILSYAKKHNCCTESDTTDESQLDKVVHEYNNALMFDSEELKMAFSVRDPVTKGAYQVVSESRGFCQNLKVKSRMYDASIVVDGGESYRFNDGAVVELSILPEDALLCVKIDE